MLKDCLSAEARTKRVGIQFDITKIAGINAKVPKQDNCSDCGLFLLGYVAEFLNDDSQDPVTKTLTLIVRLRTGLKWYRVC
jgi:Ulp1 family protease